jgi:hypothetical protein
MALYFADMTHTALGFKLREKVKFNPTDLDVDMTGKVMSQFSHRVGWDKTHLSVASRSSSRL